MNCFIKVLYAFQHLFDEISSLLLIHEIDLQCCASYLLFFKLLARRIAITTSDDNKDKMEQQQQHEHRRRGSFTTTMSSRLNLANTNAKFYGRKFELQQLQDAYERLTNGDEFDRKAQMVLITGYSGIGKSTLVRKSQEQLKAKGSGSREQQPYFISGKADQQRNQDPFSSIASAFSELCTKLIETLSKEDLNILRRQLWDAIGGEDGYQVLQNIIPESERLLIASTTSTIATAETGKRYNHTTNRRNMGHKQQYIFHAFVKALCTNQAHNSPLILFLDDLQWTDLRSLQLLTGLMTDNALTNFMLIGAYRDNEVDDQHPLSNQLEQIRKRGCVNLITLHLGSMSIEDIGQLISNILNMDISDLRELTQIIYHKTEGNILYTFEALEMLERTKILKYNYATYKWEWDIERLKTEMNMSDNVVEIVTAKLQSLSLELRWALVLASFLPRSFQIHILQELYMKSLMSQQQQSLILELEEGNMPIVDYDDPGFMVKLLDLVVTDGILINNIGTTKYRFGHDRIQQAAKTLVSRGNRDKLSVFVALMLIDMATMPDIGEDWMLFMAADNLNIVPAHHLVDIDGMDPIQMARLNVQVGTKAANKSAFVVAAEYFQLALANIENISDRWTLHYNLCLELYTASSEIEFCIGNFSRGHGLAQEVLFHAKSAEDKFRAHLSLAEGLGMKERHKEALSLQVEAVQSLGVYPKYFQVIHILRLYSKMKDTFKKFTDEEILNLPTISDPTMIMAFNALSDMVVRAFFCNQIGVALLCTFRGLELMFNQGLCSSCYHFLASYGTMLAGPFGDFETGCRIGALVTKMADHLERNDHEARSLFVVGCYIEAWDTPLTVVQKRFKRSYQSGMESGDVEFGFLSLASAILYSYVAGMPLYRTTSDIEVLFGKTGQYGVDSIRVMLKPFRQALLILSVEEEGDKDPLHWARSTEKELDRKCKDPSQTFKWLWEFQMRMQLAYYFKDYRMAERMQDCLMFYVDADPSFATSTFSLFFSGLIATARFRETRKRKYKRRALKATANMKKLMKTKGVNNLHKYYLMDADCSATFQKKSKFEEVKKKFDQAISAAAKAGFMQDTALAKELAGEYFLRTNDVFWAEHYLTESYHAYMGWQATRKAIHLKQAHGSLIKQVGRRQSRIHRESDTRRAVTRMSSDVEKMHNSLNLNQESDELRLSSGTLPTNSYHSLPTTSSINRSIDVKSQGNISALNSSVGSPSLEKDATSWLYCPLQDSSNMDSMHNLEKEKGVQYSSIKEEEGEECSFFSKQMTTTVTGATAGSSPLEGDKTEKSIVSIDSLDLQLGSLDSSDSLDQ